MKKHEAVQISRRQFCGTLAATSLLPFALHAEEPTPFRLNYLVASSMYGKLPLADVIAQTPKAGSMSLDIWRAPHADQREQATAMGDDAFAALLKMHGVKLKATTIWGKPFEDELRFVKKMGGDLLITGFVPKSDAKGFIEKLKPQLALAQEMGVTVAIENHGSDMDAIRQFADEAKSPQLKIALAPYHLPQDAQALGKLIEAIGPKIGLFYAWQHGMGAMKKLPKADELKQMPGRGDLDFTPMLAALKKIKYAGPTEIFMHPVPRGVPILDTAEMVTAEINRAAAYLESCLKKV